MLVLGNVSVVGHSYISIQVMKNCNTLNCKLTLCKSDPCSREFDAAKHSCSSYRPEEHGRVSSSTVQDYRTLRKGTRYGFLRRQQS